MRRIASVVLALAVVMVSSGASSAAVDPAHKVFGDPTNDGGLLAPDFTPPWQDLTAGYISVKSDQISFTWEVADLSVHVPETPQFYWEFALADTPEGAVPCTEDPSRCYAIGAALDATGPNGTLEANCAVVGTLIQCEEIEDAGVVVTVEGNQVTATVDRSKLGSPAAGTILYEVDLFEGIGAYTQVGLSFGGTGDLADLCVDADGSELCPSYYTIGA